MPAPTRPHLIFTLCLVAAASRAAKLPAAEARTHFFQTIDTVLKLNYNVQRVFETATNLLQAYAIKESNEHVINIECKSAASGGLDIEFKKSKKDDIIKNFAEYHTEEIEMQSKALRELVRRMPQYNFKGPNTLFFNTIADVKQRISALASPAQQLVFEQEFRGDRLEMRLRSRESLLGLFEIRIDNSRDPEYFIIVDFTISHSNREEASSVIIPVFYEDANGFDQLMETVTAKLDLAKFVNNNADNLGQLAAFVRANFKQLAFGDKPAGSTDERKVFELRFEKQAARGEVLYLPPADGRKLGGYRVSIFRDDQLYSSAEYQRTSFAGLAAEFAKLQLGALFEGLWEKIKRVYKAKYGQFLDKVYPRAEWRDSTYKPAIWSPEELVLTLELNVVALMRLGFTKKADKATLKFAAPKPGLKYLRYEFHPDDFRQDMLESYFDMIFESYVWVLQEEKKKVVV